MAICAGARAAGIGRLRARARWGDEVGRGGGREGGLGEGGEKDEWAGNNKREAVEARRSTQAGARRKSARHASEQVRKGKIGAEARRGGKQTAGREERRGEGCGTARGGPPRPGANGSERGPEKNKVRGQRATQRIKKEKNDAEGDKNGWNDGSGGGWSEKKQKKSTWGEKKTKKKTVIWKRADQSGRSAPFGAMRRGEKLERGEGGDDWKRGTRRVLKRSWSESARRGGRQEGGREKSGSWSLGEGKALATWWSCIGTGAWGSVWAIPARF